jgi:citrate lyase subunit beta/citryl-CoA lyase
MADQDGPVQSPIQGSGEAGRRGSDVRSDCWVVFEPGEEGAVTIGLTSKVDGLYGASIHTLVEECAESLGVDSAKVSVEDQGALPWVIQARVEAAFLRAGGDPQGDARPPATAFAMAAPGGTSKTRVRRSRLYLPGNEPKFMINAGLHNPDGVILDLEDSVHPREKDAARLVVRNALRCVDFGGAERMVRVNQGDLGLDDLDVVVPEAPDLILIPKAETADQVQTVAEHITALRAEEEAPAEIWLMPIVESALGIENAFSIATAHDSVAAITIGLEDFTADLGVVKTSSGDESLWARSRIVNAAKAAGIQAIDSVFSDVADEEGLLGWGMRSRSMGFEGMGCIHPRQIRVIHRAYAPSEDELDRALRIVGAFEEAERDGLGVVSLGSKMIDRPVVLRAQRLVSRARQTGLVGDDENGVEQ